MKTYTLLKSASKLAIASLASAALFGCGGGGNVVLEQSALAPPPAAPQPTAPVSFSVSGTVTGLNGIAEITVNGETVSQSANGGFEFEGIVSSGDTVIITVPSDPFGQACAVTSGATVENVTGDVTGVVVDCVNIPVVNARVQNFFTGEGVEAAEVRLSRQENGETVTETATVNDDGIAAFEVPFSAGRLSISSNPDGFGAQTIIVETPDVAKIIAADIFLQSTDVSTSFGNTVGADISVGEDIIAVIPVDSFVDTNGVEVAGDISLELNLIDPSQSSELMPGDFLTQNLATGSISQLESFGAADLTFQDAAGNPVQLATNKLITLRIPVPERVAADAPASLPLYFLDVDTGYWVEEGSADLVTLPSGKIVFEGPVTQGRTWTVGRTVETVQATGCAVDTEGEPISGIRIQAEGSDYIGLSRATTDTLGVYTLPVRANSTQFVSTFRGSQSRTLTMSSGAQDFTFANAANPESCLIVRNADLGANSASMTLTWGENPRDLDSYFYGRPTLETEIDTPFQIYFARPQVTVNNQTIFLDVDDVDSFGPEIITVPSFPYEGVYTYGVDLFAGDGTIASSAARVQINLGGSTSVYSVPEGEPTRCWAVMRFIVDAEGNVTRETIGTWEEREYCTMGTGIAGETGEAKPNYGDVDPALMKSE